MVLFLGLDETEDVNAGRRIRRIGNGRAPFRTRCCPGELECSV